MDLLCWGNGEFSQTVCGNTRNTGQEKAHLAMFTAAGLGRVKLLACGSSHSIVVTVDNRIFAWGNGTSGQLGNGERTVKDQPVEVKLTQQLHIEGEDAHVNPTSIVGVACGSRHSFIWTETGQAHSFGNNFYAQLGYDFQRADFKENQLAPRLFQNLPLSLKIAQVACGERHTLFALKDGNIAACGNNDFGQIGCGSNESAPVPRFVELVGHVSKVTCGANHNLALTGDGRLFQWGCGRACGSMKRNILFPEEVTLPSSPVRDIAGGCWHSLLLTDGGNVFSWGIGQEGQLGLGEDRIHISTPCLLSYSQPLTLIRAGDSYSAAVTAGGDLLLWGQIPWVSRVSDHPGLRRRFWTPQAVPLAGRKVCDFACGTWHIIALTTGGEEKNGEYSHPETETCFTDLGSAPLPTEHAEKENTEHDLKQVPHTLLKGQVGPEGAEGQEKDEESEVTEEEDSLKATPDSILEEGSLHPSAFSVARSSMGIFRRGNRHPSFKPDLEDGREGCRTQKLTKEVSRGRDVVYTTLHFLPRPEGERCRPAASILPRLLTGQQAHSKSLSKARKDSSTHLIELVHKPGSLSSNLHSSTPKPRPPTRNLGAQRSTTCHHSEMAHTELESPVCPYQSPGQRVQNPTYRSPSEPQGQTSPSSDSLRYCSAHRRVFSSFSNSWKN